MIDEEIERAIATALGARGSLVRIGGFLGRSEVYSDALGVAVLKLFLHAADALGYRHTVRARLLAYASPNGGGSVGKSAAGRFGAVLGDLMTLLGGDLEKLRARYDLSVDKADGGLVLGARPLAAEVKRHVKSLSLRLPVDLWSVQRIEIEESGGDRSVIAFPRMVRDVKVDPARMVPPKGR
jgi:hypothetical protein